MFQFFCFGLKMLTFSSISDALDGLCDLAADNDKLLMLNIDGVDHDIFQSHFDEL